MTWWRHSSIAMTVELVNDIHLVDLIELFGILESKCIDREINPVIKAN